jgi:hypothetical protein
VPPSAEEQRRRDDEAEAWRAERERHDGQRRPGRLAALRTGPELRDLDAAADCHCGCHPSGADPELHDGGSSCPCQQTPEERKRAMQAFFDDLAQIGPLFDTASDEAALARRAAELGVTAKLQASACPFVITGHIDGRGFYLRERHGEYGITVPSDDDPTAEPWGLDPHEPTLDIAEDDEKDLTGPDGRFDVATALTVAVDAVRTFLARRSCPHEQPRDEYHVFCSRCGVRLTDAERWRSD